MKANYLLMVVLISLVGCSGRDQSEVKDSTSVDLKIAPAKESVEEMKPELQETPLLVDEEVRNSSVVATKTSYQRLLQKMSPKTQTYKVSVNADTTIVCSYGTLLKIDAGSFVTEDWGKAVKGEVEIQVREFYELSDMILAGLSTTSGKQLLETGGMIHISATSDGIKCKVKEKGSIKIGFLTDEVKENMQLFAGSTDRRGRFDWTLSSFSKKIDTMIVAMPKFPGGDSVLVNYLETTFKHPDRSRLRTQFSRVNVSFTLDAKGEVIDARILNGISVTVDEEVLSMICNMPNWVPAIEDGNYVSSRIELPVYFGLDPKRSRTPYRVFASNYNTPIDKNESKKVESKYYFLDSPTLGWLNCDRFVNPSNNQMTVACNGAFDLNVQMVFHSIQGIVNGFPKDGRIYFTNLPKGEKVTLIAFGNVNYKPHMTIKETTTDEALHSLQLTTPMSKEILTKEMAKLERRMGAWN